MRYLCAVTILFVLTGISCKPPDSKVSPTESDEKLAALNQQLKELNGWQLRTETDPMDKTPNVYLAKFAEGSDVHLFIRCSRGKTALFVATIDVVDDGNVRVKFDDAKPEPQSWSEAADHAGLFASDPIGLARRLAKTESFLFEYKPFQKQPTTVVFKVNGLAEKLGPLEEACGWVKIDQAKANANAAAKAYFERTRKCEAMLREVLSRYVGACHEKWLQDMGRWCWYDEASSGFKGGTPFESKEAALDDAVQTAKSGQLFTHEVAQIDSQLKEISATRVNTIALAQSLR